jgi:hypothetical protein
MAANRWAVGCDCCGECEQVCVTVTCACRPTGTPAVGTEVQLLDRFDNVVDACTIDETGKCCLEPSHPDQYWVRTVAQGGDTQQGCVPPVVEVDVTCGQTCEDSVPCTAGGVLYAAGGSIVDIYGLHELAYDATLGAYVTSGLQFNSARAYDVTYDAEVPVCTGLSEARYQYRVSCDGDNIRCQVYTPPLAPCLSDPATCGYEAAESGTLQPATSNTFTSSAAPVVDGGSLTADFAFDDVEGPCLENPVPPPSPWATVSLPINADDPAVTCCSPCPLPLRDLALAYDDGAGHVTSFALAFDGHRSYASGCVAKTIGGVRSLKATASCLGVIRLAISSYSANNCTGAASVASNTDAGWAVSRYVCEPLDVTWTNGAATMRLTEA